MEENLGSGEGVSPEAAASAASSFHLCLYLEPPKQHSRLLKAKYRPSLKRKVQRGEEFRGEKQPQGAMVAAVRQGLGTEVWVTLRVYSGPPR